MDLLPPPLPAQKKCCFLGSGSVPLIPCKRPRNLLFVGKNPGKVYVSIHCSSPKIVRSPSLDRLVVKQNRIRFVQKLKTLLLSKPKHYLPLHVLNKCRSYLSLTDSRSIRSMISRYPSIFELFKLPTPPLPFNATKPCSQLCVRLTPAAAALAAQESDIQSAISANLVVKLQKLLMLSSHHRLLLSKLVHLAPDLGLPPNFRSRLCNDHSDKFRTVETSYGRALELLSWDSELALPLPRPEVSSNFIVDRPLKFKQLILRKGLNVKRRHRDFLVKFSELPDICPYKTSIEELAKESIEAEKRACAVVREVLGMTIEKRTLIDHLTHFRKEFGLPNKLRGMILRHPEMFYVSLKGLRDSVFLLEAYDDKGALIRKDETSVINERLMELATESKRLRRERRKKAMMIDDVTGSCVAANDDNFHDSDSDDFGDGFLNVFTSEDLSLEYNVWDDFQGGNESVDFEGTGDFWTAQGPSIGAGEGPVDP